MLAPHSRWLMPWGESQLRTLLLQGVLRRFRLGDVDYAVYVERDLLCVGAPMLVVEAVCVFAVFRRVEGVVAGGHAALVDLVAARWCLDLDTSVSNCCCVSTHGFREFIAYPEVNLQIAATTKLPVANLEGDCHLVVFVKLLVEAFALVSLHLDVVRRCEGEKAARRCEKAKGREQHLCDRSEWLLCCVVALKGLC